MTTQRHPSFRLQDQIEGVRNPTIDLRPFLGRWRNTNPETRGVSEISIREDGGSLKIRVLGAGGPAPSEWGEVTAEALFCDGPGSSQGMAFSASFDFGFLRAKLGGNVNQGLLVVAFWHQFTDQSGRIDTFNREFFHQ